MQPDLTEALRPQRGERVHDRPLDSPLRIIHAQRDGDVLQVVGEDVNAPDRAGDRPLHLAVYKGHAECVRLMLTRGADPNRHNRVGHAPLSTACTNGHPAVADLLVAAGAEVGVVGAAYLGDLPLLERLLDGGMEVETRDAEGVTSLIAAAGCGHVEVVRLLLDRGADPNAEGRKGQTALTGAVAREHVPVIHLLIDGGADPDAASGRFGSTPLELAASFGKATSVRALLARGADPNKAAGTSGWTPLHHCAHLAAFPRLARDGAMPRIAALLLDAGAAVDARDAQGKTPLMAAASEGDAGMVALLLSRGADVRASDATGYATPLACVRSMHGPKDRRDKSEARTLVMAALGPEYAILDAAERGDAVRLDALLDAGAPADRGIVFDPRLVDVSTSRPKTWRRRR